MVSCRFVGLFRFLLFQLLNNYSEPSICKCSQPNAFYRQTLQILRLAQSFLPSPEVWYKATDSCKSLSYCLKHRWGRYLRCSSKRLQRLRWWQRDARHISSDTISPGVSIECHTKLKLATISTVLKFQRLNRCQTSISKHTLLSMRLLVPNGCI